MLLRTRASVSFASVSASGSERSTLIRATSLARDGRSFSPAASSVVSISDSAVETQASSGRPARFLKPRTAIARRGARTRRRPPSARKAARGRRRGRPDRPPRRRARPPRRPSGAGAAAPSAGSRGTGSPRSARHDVARGREAVRRIALEAAQDRLLPDGRQIRRVPARRGRRLLELLQRDRQRRVALERHAPGDHLVDHDAERVDVGGGRRRRGPRPARAPCSPACRSRLGLRQRASARRAGRRGARGRSR